MAALVASACLAAGALALPAAASTTTTGARFVPPLTGASGGGAVVPRLPAGTGHRAIVLPLAALRGQRGPARSALTAMGARHALAGRPGTVTGTVRGLAGQPLAGACVTAGGLAGSATARTSADGRFTMNGLRAGRYTLEFRDCAAPGRYWAQWSGGAMAPTLASPLHVRAGVVTRVAPVTLRPASRAALFAQPSTTRSAHAAGGPASNRRIKFGGVSGRLTGPHGQRVTGTCVEISNRGLIVGIPTRSAGHRREDDERRRRGHAIRRTDHRQGDRLTRTADQGHHRRRLR
jgi:hypothetical protein